MAKKTNITFSYRRLNLISHHIEHQATCSLNCHLTCLWQLPPLDCVWNKRTLRQSPLFRPYQHKFIPTPEKHIKNSFDKFTIVSSSETTLNRLFFCTILIITFYELEWLQRCHVNALHLRYFIDVINITSNETCATSGYFVYNKTVIML